MPGAFLQWIVTSHTKLLLTITVSISWWHQLGIESLLWTQCTCGAAYWEYKTFTKCQNFLLLLMHCMMYFDDGLIVTQICKNVSHHSLHKWSVSHWYQLGLSPCYEHSSYDICQLWDASKLRDHQKIWAQHRMLLAGMHKLLITQLW